MSDEDFERGKAVTELKNIKKEIAGIQTAFKEHNTSDLTEFTKLNGKLDKGNTQTRVAIDLAKRAILQTDQQKKTNEEQHKENKAELVEIKGDVKELVKTQQSQALLMAKWSGMALVAGGLGSYVFPLVIHFFTR